MIDLVAWFAMSLFYWAKTLGEFFKLLSVKILSYAFLF